MRRTGRSSRCCSSTATSSTHSPTRYSSTKRSTRTKPMPQPESRELLQTQPTSPPPAHHRSQRRDPVSRAYTHGGNSWSSASCATRARTVSLGCVRTCRPLPCPPPAVDPAGDERDQEQETPGLGGGLVRLRPADNEHEETCGNDRNNPKEQREADHRQRRSHPLILPHHCRGPPGRQSVLAAISMRHCRHIARCVSRGREPRPTRGCASLGRRR